MSRNTASILALALALAAAVAIGLGVALVVINLPVVVASAAAGVTAVVVEARLVAAFARKKADHYGRDDEAKDEFSNRKIGHRGIAAELHAERGESDGNQQHKSGFERHPRTPV